MCVNIPVYLNLNTMEQKKPTNVDTNALIESVKSDMLNIERGKQWIMSSYSPFKDKAAFSGFVDDSFEEIRLGYYEAQKTGELDLYFQQIQTKHREALLRVKRLQSPTPDFISIFVQLYNTPAPVTISSASSYFGNTGNAVNISIFSTNQQQTWGTPQASSSNNIFGQSNTNSSNPFANPNSSNIFAKPVNSIFASNNIFNKSSGQTGVFGQSNSNMPIFGASAFGSQNMTGSLYGSTNAQGGTIFGQSSGANSIFGGSASTAAAVFGSPPTQNSSIFGTSTSQPSTIFSSSNTQPAVFGTSNVFGGNQTVFGSSIPQTTGQSIFGSPSTFGGPNATPADIFNKSASFLNPQPVTQNVFSSQPAPPLYGATVATSPPSIFGSTSTASQPMFGSAVATSQPSIFGSSSVATSQPPIFGTNSVATSQSSVFAPSSAATSVFGDTTQSIIFGSALPNTQGFNTSPFKQSVFGQQTFGQNLATQPGIFGNTETDNSVSSADVVSNTPFASVSSSVAVSSAPFMSGGSSNAPFATVSPFINPVSFVETLKQKLTPRDYARTNPEYYSTELTDADLAAFQNMTFEFGSIPIDPPTVDLCA